MGSCLTSRSACLVLTIVIEVIGKWCYEGKKRSWKNAELRKKRAQG